MKIISLSILILSLCSLISAQSSLAEFDKIRQIRLLHDNREMVRRILADYKADFSEDDEESDSDDFNTNKVGIEVYYSDGDCSQDELWNAEKLTVVKVEAYLKNQIKIKDFKFDFSGYTRKIEDSTNSYLLYNETDGIAFEIEKNKIRGIIFFPSKGNVSLLCENKTAKEFSSPSNEKQFIDLIVKRGETSCPVANVNALSLETFEIIADCEDPEKRLNCTVWNKEISVKTNASDSDNDPLTYQYTVSGGKIVGQGAKVVWDLSGLKLGTYTITAAVDDGCGFCGQTQTKTIVVK